MDRIWDLGDLDEVIDDLFEEIDFGSDRATAIVLAAFVEDRLTHFIRSRLVKDDLGRRETRTILSHRLNQVHLHGTRS